MLHGSGVEFNYNKHIQCAPALVCLVGKHNILRVSHLFVHDVMKYDQLLLPFSWGGGDSIWLRPALSQLGNENLIGQRDV